MRKILVVCSLALNVVIQSAGGAQAEISESLDACRAPGIIGPELDAVLENPPDVFTRRASRAEAKVKMANCARDAILKVLPASGSMRTISRDPRNAEYANSLALFVGILQGSTLKEREAVLLEVLLEFQNLDGDASLAADSPTATEFFSTYTRVLQFQYAMAQDEAARFEAMYRDVQTDRK